MRRFSGKLPLQESVFSFSMKVTFLKSFFNFYRTVSKVEPDDLVLKRLEPTNVQVFIHSNGFMQNSLVFLRKNRLYLPNTRSKSRKKQNIVFFPGFFVLPGTYCGFEFTQHRGFRFSSCIKLISVSDITNITITSDIKIGNWDRAYLTVSSLCQKPQTIMKAFLKPSELIHFYKFYELSQTCSRILT